MSRDTLDLLERLQTKINLDRLGEDRISIEQELDGLSDIGGVELGEIWKKEVGEDSQEDCPESQLDVIDDIMFARFGEDYERYLKGEVGESTEIREDKEKDNIYMRLPMDRVKKDAEHGVSAAKDAWYRRDREDASKAFGYDRKYPGEETKESKFKEQGGKTHLRTLKQESKEYDREEVPQTMQPQEDPDIDPEDVSVEPGDKEPEKKKQDTMTEPTEKELKQLVDKSEKENKDITAMFKEDKVDIMQNKLDELEFQAKQLEKEQKGTRKATRGYDLQHLYNKIDDYERKIAQLKKELGENRSSPLYICNECCKTFRNDIDECIYCESENVERVGLEEPKQLESKLKEQEEDNFKTIAKGIEDRDIADKLATEKKGKVIQDEEDEKKFTVIVKEGRLEDQKADLEKEMMELDTQHRKDMNRIGIAIDKINQELEAKKKEEEE